MGWPNEITVEGYSEYVRALHAFITRGEVIHGKWSAKFIGLRRIIVRPVGQWVEVVLSSDVVVAIDGVDKVSGQSFRLEPTAIPVLSDLLHEGYCKLGPIGVRAKLARPSLVVDNVDDHVRIRCVDTVLELDYPGGIDPDINEIRLYKDRMTIDKSGVDIHVKFV